MSRVSPLSLSLLLLLVSPAAFGLDARGDTIFSANGTAAGILPTVDAFRAALGTLNPPGACSPTPCTSGRREINWDAVPSTSFDPFPGDFFNAGGSPAGRTRGLSMTAPGTLAVSDTSFGSPLDFPPFSADKIFGTKGTNVYDIFFHVPGQPSSVAGVSGMGIVFIDVESPGLTTMSFFEFLTNTPLGSFAVPAGESGRFSFLGVTFSGASIGRVRVQAGDGGIDGCELDCVAIDDFIYGEPTAAVPEPSSLALLGVGLLAVLRRTRR